MSPSLDALCGSHIDGPPFEDVQNGGQTGYHTELEPVTNGHSETFRSNMQPTPANEVHDLVCAGFGPACLAIAVALHDYMDNGKLSKSQGSAPKVRFLEKQQRFAWHSGMLLPGAKMQISFIKDMASLRDPRSHFTFLNFLHQQGRLIDFTNLSTFLPARAEYDDYLRWCANHFEDVVQYGQEVVSVSPVPAKEGEPVSEFVVTSRNIKTGDITTFRSRNVIVAVGGQPKIPKCLPANNPRIVHSSQYSHLVPKILSQSHAPYRVAVIGAGQSAAEIFSNVQNLYPNSKTYLVMRSEFLKPSDDSPFVNCIFNPEFIDNLYPRSAASRHALLTDARSTNYGVVRLELIERLYERMYEQKRELGPDERKWPHRIMAATDVVGLESDDIVQENLRLRIRSLRDGVASTDGPSIPGEDVLDVDLIVVATGYQRKTHLTIIKDLASLLPEEANGIENGAEQVGEVKVGLKNGKSAVAERGVTVARDYSIQFAPGKVAQGSGVWLQGCNEETHGLSDTLLSVLATRSAEMVDSIFCQAK